MLFSSVFTWFFQIICLFVGSNSDIHLDYSYSMHLRLLSILLLFSVTALAQSPLHQKAEKLAAQVEEKMISWRHDIHQNPELSNREFKTAEKVAAHLESLGIEVQTQVAHTGVVGILKGGKPGPVVGLRADMDALPVTERVDIPFASKVMGEYNGIETGVMHACGHDTHVAILMAVADVLAQLKDDLSGTVKFIFQPAEEGAPKGEEGGAGLMVREGVLKNPDVDVIFGLHINSQTPVGHINYRAKGIMAAADKFEINVRGKQTHGSQPWGGIDPIMVSAQIVNGLQTIISRNTPLTQEAAVISVGLIQGGTRNNIIPEDVKMIGTIRTLAPNMQEDIHKRMSQMVPAIAESYGAEAKIDISFGPPVTYNDPELTAWAEPVIKRVVGAENMHRINPITGAEDFAFYAREIPGFFFFVGGCPEGSNPKDAAPHHTPDFYVDDSGMKTGVKTMLNLTLDYLSEKR